MATTPVAILTPPRRRELWLRQLMRKWSGLSNTGNNRDTPLGFEDELTALRFELEELEQNEQRVQQDFGSVAADLRGVAKTSLLRGQSETLRQQFIEHHQYRVSVHTWNVAGKPPPDDLDMEGWIHNASLPADIYVFGFQEVVPLNANNVLCMQNEGPAALWEAKIRETLNKSVTRQQALQKTMSVPLSTRNDAVNVTVAEVPEVSDVERLIAELSNLVPENPVSHGTAIKPGNKLSSRKTAQNGDSRQQMYTRVASKQMVGLFITVWIRSHLWRRVHNVQVSTVGCGLMNHLGNKGSISVSMFLHYTSFCFVCSHLTSGHKEGDALRRNGDVAEILRRTKFPRLAKLLGLGLPERILAHDRVIWLGDLNYRLALPDKETWTLVKRGDWASLLRNDQLKLEQGEGRVFPDWQEGPIYFPPTYKFQNGSDQYFSSGDGVNPNPGITGSSSKRRTPAWCDRVLWYGTGLNQLDYMCEDSKLSDHRSVLATFMAEVEVVSLTKLKKACVYPINHKMDLHYMSGPMLKPFVDVHNLHSNKAWSSLLRKLTLQQHKLQEMEMDKNFSRLLDQDVWFDANEGDEDENVLVDPAGWNFTSKLFPIKCRSQLG